MSPIKLNATLKKKKKSIVTSVNILTESAGSHVESIGSSTFILELAQNGLFGVVDDSSGFEEPIPVSGYYIVVCVSVTNK